jgi:hypothetical protein
VSLRVLVCGDRNWSDAETIRRRLERLPQDTVVVHGGARGADTLAGYTADGLGMVVGVFRAEWPRYGRAAGPLRNRAMLDTHPDLVLAFHDNLDNSKGTKDCVTEARRRGVVTEVIRSHEY